MILDTDKQIEVKLTYADRDKLKRAAFNLETLGHLGRAHGIDADNCADLVEQGAYLRRVAELIK